MKYADTALLVFAKAPIVGEVNTRLASHISVEAAAQLQVELTDQRLRTFSAAGLCELQLWCSPDCEHDYFQHCRQQFDVDLFAQQGRDLGERMSHAFETTLNAFKYVILIGTDAPTLGVEEVENAIQVLKQGKDVVLVPAEDGGYVLVGMQQHNKNVFHAVAWGTEKVLLQTRRNIIAAGLKHDELESCWDIDRPEDLERYQRLKMV